jgi:hypothetical protein
MNKSVLSASSVRLVRIISALITTSDTCPTSAVSRHAACCLLHAVCCMLQPVGSTSPLNADGCKSHQLLPFLWHVHRYFLHGNRHLRWRVPRQPNCSSCACADQPEPGRQQLRRHVPVTRDVAARACVRACVIRAMWCAQMALSLAAAWGWPLHRTTWGVCWPYALEFQGYP